eukprot:s4052_g3.t1
MDVAASAPATASDAGRPIAASSVYLLMVLLWATDAISVGSLFDVYVADVAQSTGYAHPNEFIGFLESVRGLTAFAAAFPLGYLSDRFDRLAVLRSCGFVFGLTGAVVLSVALLLGRLGWLAVGLALYAIFFQVDSATGFRFPSWGI